MFYLHDINNFMSKLDVSRLVTTVCA